MDVREKIVELLTEFYGVDPMYLGAGTNALIEYLIAKGVTVQEWISVNDRLPEEKVDAVEVVRCKDCKWLYDEMDDYCCRSHRGLARICENSFCSYGERKENE